jgi:hypothetical protein
MKRRLALPLTLVVLPVTPSCNDVQSGNDVDVQPSRGRTPF